MRIIFTKTGLHEIQLKNSANYAYNNGKFFDGGNIDVQF